MREKPPVRRSTQSTSSPSWPSRRGRARSTIDSACRLLLRSPIHRHDRLRGIIEVRHRFYRRWRHSTPRRIAARRRIANVGAKKSTVAPRKLESRALVTPSSAPPFFFCPANYPRVSNILHCYDDTSHRFFSIFIFPRREMHGKINQSRF